MVWIRISDIVILNGVVVRNWKDLELSAAYEWVNDSVGSS